MILATTKPASEVELQYTTFFVDGLLMGVPIRDVREIDRHLELTTVPHSPDFVRGVINLRGDVVTVVDLATILGLSSREMTRQSRNVVIKWEDQYIGLNVDGIADIISIAPSKITPPPANVDRADVRFYEGVYTTKDEIIVILNIDEIVSSWD